MATFTAVKNRKQSVKALKGTLIYMVDIQKTAYENRYLNTGVNCLAYSCYHEMMTTKQQYGKADGRMFYQFVQSFPEDSVLTSPEIHQLGLEFAAQQFSGFECLVSTHCNTENVHNHILVNAVSFETGKKLHQNHDDLMQHRMVNDTLCMKYGDQTLEPYDKKKKYQSMRSGEYRAAMRGNSWKLALIDSIEIALLYATNKQTFIENMEYDGYQVNWSDNHKYITYTTPEGKKCRDKSLHDETYLKENLERLFAFREATGFVPLTPEPMEGWLGELQQHENLLQKTVSLGKNLENITPQPPPHTPIVWTDHKQRQREMLKKLAQGQKLSNEPEQQYSMSM